jgi:hypothetical protein
MSNLKHSKVFLFIFESTSPHGRCFHQLDLPLLYPNLPPFNRKPFGLYDGEGLLTWASPSFQADTLEAPTFKLGEGC